MWSAGRRQEKLNKRKITSSYINNLAVANLRGNYMKICSSGRHEQPRPSCSWYGRHYEHKGAQQKKNWDLSSRGDNRSERRVLNRESRQKEVKRESKRQRRGRQRAQWHNGDLITADACTVMPANYPTHLSSSLGCDQMGGLMKCSERWEWGRFNYVNYTCPNFKQYSKFA